MQIDCSDVRIYRLAEVMDITGHSAPTIARLERAGQFPKRIKISERSSGWRSDELRSWIEERTAASRTPEGQIKAHENPVKHPPHAAPVSDKPRRRGRPSKANGI